MKKNQHKPIGTLVLKDNGSIDVHYHSSEEQNVELFETAYKYIFYALTRYDWMSEFSQILEDQENQEKKEIKKPDLKIVK